MRQSKLFTKTKKEVPADEISKNAELLIRGGFVFKEMAGVYSFLPLGLKVLNNIQNIIREEMNNIGGEELSMTALQNPDIWKKTDRFSDEKVDIWFKTKLKNDSELGLGFTHEEPLTNIVKNYVSSYRDLPFSAYQFQTKFRNETRAKSGIMRCREFIMKDLYSFSKDEVQHNEFYEKAKEAYLKIFKRIGIGHLTYLTFASGGSFSKFSHEFQTIASTGEDTIYINEENNIAINKEVFTDEVKNELGLTGEFKETKAVEVGNIFTLGTRFSEALDLTYQTENGDKKPVFMGSYGIGPGRLMGTVVEVLSDDKGIIWPESIAPFKVHLLVLGEDEEVKKESEYVYESLSKKNIEVLFDDRVGLSPGEKFADADLLGMPFRVVVSARSIKEKGVEIKKRNEEKGKVIPLDELLDLLKLKPSA